MSNNPIKPNYSFSLIWKMKLQIKKITIFRREIHPFVQYLVNAKNP